MAGVRTTEMTENADVTGGDQRALESFFADHYRRLVGLAGLVCGDVASAEDIVQTSLERAWRARGTMRDDTRLRPWLDRIVVREAAREKAIARDLAGSAVPPAHRPWDRGTGRRGSGRRRKPISLSAWRCVRRSMD